MNMKKDFEHVICNICGSNSSDIFFEGKDIVHNKKGIFTVVQCKNCGLLFTNPRPKQSIISRYYPNTYWDAINPKENIESKLKIQAHKFLNKISYQIRIPTKINGKFLDIGCGDGKELYKYKRKGWNTFGVEINDFVAKYAREKYDLNIFTGTVEEACFRDEYFDLIILNHVIEHLSDPKATLTEIKRILKSNGTLIISLPNADSFEAKRFKEYWTGWDLPRHLYHFTPSTITSLLNETGFEIIKIDFDSNPNNVLASLKYVLKDKRVNTLFALSLCYPFAIILSFFLSRFKLSYNMFVFARTL